LHKKKGKFFVLLPLLFYRKRKATFHKALKINMLALVQKKHFYQKTAQKS